MSQLSNTVAETPLQFEQRKSLAVAFWFKEFDGYRTNPLDLTGATLRFAAAQQANLGGALVIEKDIDLINELGGTAQLNLQASDLDLAPGEYLYTATLITAEGFSAVFMKGELEVLENQDLLSVDEEYSGVAAPQSLSVLLGKQNRVIIGVEHLPAPKLKIGTVGITAGNPTAEIVGEYPNQELNLEFPVTPIDYDVTDQQIAQFIENDASDSAQAVDERVDEKLATKTWTVSQITDFTEEMMDQLSTRLLEGTNIDIDYDDTLGTLTISSTGGGGGGETLKFHPKMYGAVGDGVADDSDAIIAAGAAARAFGGTVYIGGQENTVYGITKDVKIYGETGLEGDQYVGQLAATGSTIKYLSSTALLRMGGREVGQSARGGSFHDFNIDCNGFGELGGFYVDFGVSRSFYNISVIDGVGDGVIIDTTQNSTFTNVEISGFVNGTGLVLDNGCGGNLFMRCEIANNAIDVETRDSRPGAHNGYPFGPGRNTFLHCLLEDYNTGGEGVARLKAGWGQTLRFLSTAFSASAEAQSSGYLAVIETQGLIQTEVIFGGGCTFYGHNDTDAIYVGNNARVVIEGSVGVGACPHIFATDGTSYGRIEGRIDFLPPTELWNQLPGGSFLNWKKLQHVGQDVIIDTSVTGALPYRMYRKGELYPRYTLNDDGVVHFNDGVNPISLATLGWDVATYQSMVGVGGLVLSGRRGHVRSTNVTASGSVTLNTKTASVWTVITAGNITAMAFSNPVNNAEFTLQIGKSSVLHSIVWPTDVQFANGREPSVSTNYTFITFRYDGTDSKWKEIARAEEVGALAKTGKQAAYAQGNIATFPDFSVFQADGQCIRATLTGNITITPALLPKPQGSAQRVLFRFTQDGTGSRTMTLDAAIKSAGGTDPVLSTAAGATDIVEFVYTGLEWVARMLANAIA